MASGGSPRSRSRSIELRPADCVFMPNAKGRSSSGWIGHRRANPEVRWAENGFSSTSVVVRRRFSASELARSRHPGRQPGGIPVGKSTRLRGRLSTVRSSALPCRSPARPQSNPRLSTWPWTPTGRPCVTDWCRASFRSTFEFRRTRIRFPKQFCWLSRSGAFAVRLPASMYGRYPADYG